MTTSKDLKHEMEFRAALIATQKDLVKQAQTTLETLEEMQAGTARALALRLIAESSDAFPVGTRVKHHSLDVYGVVAENHGDGVAVTSPSGETTYGYHASEWVTVK